LRHIALKRGLRYRFNTWKVFFRGREQRKEEAISNELDRKIERLNELNSIMVNHNSVRIGLISSC
jgi:hypothetical protein